MKKIQKCESTFDLWKRQEQKSYNIKLSVVGKICPSLLKYTSYYYAFAY